MDAPMADESNADKAVMFLLDKYGDDHVPTDAEVKTLHSIGEQEEVDRIFVAGSPEPEVEASDDYRLERREYFKTALAAGKLRWDVKGPSPHNPSATYARTSTPRFLTLGEAFELHRRWFEKDESFPVAERCVGLIKLSDVWWR
jgi:hypothetical protein